MDVDSFLSFWQQHFPKCPPVSYLFKWNLADRWFRFHSLPKSKRYAKDETEVAELLARQNKVLLDVAGPGECILVSGNYSSSPPLDEQCPALSNFEFQEFLKLSKQDFDPDELEPDEKPVYLSLFCGTHNLKPGSLDDIFLCIADWKIVNFFVVNCEQERIFAPYNGGVDVILKDTEERDKFKSKYKNWLPTHPEGP